MASHQPEVGFSPVLSLRTSPGLIAAREILQLPSIAVEAAVESELGSNPALERVESGECPLCTPAWGAACPLCLPRGSASRGSPADRQRDLMPELPGQESDVDVLLRDVRLRIPSRDFPIAEYLVGSLDAHGFLDQAPPELAQVLAVSAERVSRVLHAIQQEGPPGIAAAGVRECLVLQLEHVPAGEDLRRVARSVIEDHLPAVAKGHHAAICRALGISRDVLADALDLIRTRLRPYPAFEGRSCATSPIAYRCVPDVVITEHGKSPSGFDVELVEPRRFRLRINPAYLQAARHAAPAEQRRLRASVAEARSLVAGLEERWDTLRQVAEAVTERQGDFIRRGPLWRGPLTRVEVASDLGLHESTVSRAVAAKYAMLPSRQMVALADFFSASGGLGEEIRAMVAAEPHALSDEQLAERLRARGYQVARRTVTKYRLRAGIPAAALR